MLKKCDLIHPETGKKIPAQVIQKDKLRMTVRPEGTKFDIFLVRGDASIPYRGRFRGQYFTVQEF
jgi:hypothetical protein